MGGPRARRGRSRPGRGFRRCHRALRRLDRKSTRLNSSHQIISYAVFCLKKKKTTCHATPPRECRHPLLRALPRLERTLVTSLSPCLCVACASVRATPTSQRYPLSLHDALPISAMEREIHPIGFEWAGRGRGGDVLGQDVGFAVAIALCAG